MPYEDEHAHPNRPAKADSGVKRSRIPNRRTEERFASRWVLRFALTFLALVLTFSAILQVADAAVSRALCAITAQIVVATLTLFGTAPVLVDRTISYGGASVQIVPECTGIEVIGLFIAAVLAFPSSWQRKSLGLATCIPPLLIVNLIRMVSLVWVAERSPKALEYGHSYVWPTVVLAVALGMWLSWMEMVARDRRLAD